MFASPLPPSANKLKMGAGDRKARRDKKLAKCKSKRGQRGISGISCTQDTEWQPSSYWKKQKENGPDKKEDFASVAFAVDDNATCVCLRMDGS